MQFGEVFCFYIGIDRDLFFLKNLFQIMKTAKKQIFNIRILGENLTPY